jgi:hypothetical protein
MAYHKSVKKPKRQRSRKYSIHLLLSVSWFGANSSRPFPLSCSTSAGNEVNSLERKTGIDVIEHLAILL